MKITVKEIDKKYQNNMDACRALIEQEKNARDSAEMLNSQAEAAACSGNVEAYSDLRNRAQEAEDRAYVLGKRIEQMNGADMFSDEEINEAWKNYADEHNKQLAAKLKIFNETKSDLLRQYAEMVTQQRETCAVRERLSAYIGLQKKIAPDYGLGARFPMDYIPCLKGGENGTLNIRGANINDPDAAYYIASFKKDPLELVKDEATQTAVRVVGSHQSK